MRWDGHVDGRDDLNGHEQLSRLSDWRFRPVSWMWEPPAGEAMRGRSRRLCGVLFEGDAPSDFSGARRSSVMQFAGFKLICVFAFRTSGGRLQEVRGGEMRACFGERNDSVRGGGAIGEFFIPLRHLVVDDAVPAGVSQVGRHPVAAGPLADSQFLNDIKHAISTQHGVSPGFVSTER